VCELMTIGAALVFTALHFALWRSGRPSPAVLTTMLMFWGAALMWSVDCVANRMEGDPLLDFSREDLVLGFIVLGFGLAAHIAFLLIGRRKAPAGYCAKAE